MSHIILKCSECGATRAADMFALGCVECESPLNVAYSDAGRHTMSVCGLGMPVPVHADRLAITLGEGATPIVPLSAVGDMVGVSRVLGKLEFMNPTGSFKDRGTAMMLSVASEHGISELVEDSSGNAGASVSAYAARAGIVAHVFAPDTAPEAKMGQIAVYGARTHPTAGPREASANAADEYRRRHEIVYASHNLSPYFIEGTKTFAYEVAARMSPAPDHIVIPVGNGSLLLGAWAGYAELLAAGVVASIPKLHAIQSEAVMPIVSKFDDTQEWSAGRTTVAGGIAVSAPPRGAQVIRALRDTGGIAAAVNDAEIVRWQRLLAEREGIFAEPTSAAAFAGLQLLAERGHIAPDESALVAITGFGLKDALPI